MITIGNGNRSNVAKSGWFTPTRLAAFFFHISIFSLLAHVSSACFKPFNAASKSPHNRSGYIRFSTITAAKLSKPCDLMGTFMSDDEFDKLPNSHTLQTLRCKPCPGPPVRRPNEYSNAKVGLIVSDRSRKLLIIDVLPFWNKSTQTHNFYKLFHRNEYLCKW